MDDATATALEYPCQPAQKPPKARHHCRHYSYEIPNGGGVGECRCAVDVDLSAEGAWRACIPDPDRTCERREEWSDEERSAFKAWSDDHIARMVHVVSAIPKDGTIGTLTCPACGTGKVHWTRARSNGHLHAQCTTPNCFWIMQ